MTTADAIIALELGHYRLREQIGGSAYGIIWRASGPPATRDVAIKLINREQMERALPVQRERWISAASNEIAFLQSLEPWDERHIVRLLDSGWHEGLPVLALELMGSDLGKHMIAMRGRNETVPLAQALGWIAQLNQALAKVHQYGWRYLDLKPANVLLDPHLRTVKLADFGTNRELGSLQAHSYAGTANWQAPEQFFPADGGGYATSARSDYFSLGAVLYFLATGLPLRYCVDCGQAYREHHVAGADVLRGRNGGEIPCALQPEEEQRFAAAIPADQRDATLALLHALLQIDPMLRPRHAIQISRMLNAAQGTKPPRGAFDAADPVLGMHRPSAVNRWQTMQGA
jgi:serine/threonine-protein kinase